MALNKYKLGELIEPCELRNNTLQFGENEVMGMTIEKEIIPTKANVAGSDLSKYLVVYPKQFIYNPRTHGEKIGLGFNNTKSPFIISWNNIAFKIKDMAISKALPEYLYIYFNRKEWDRNACFCSWGSSTEVFSWIALCSMDIELPSIEVQQKYVDIYQGMVANQKAYESGLNDLKLVCDAYIEELRRKMPCEPIGKYIIQRDEKNDIGLTIDNVRGISTAKEFIETKADMDGVGLTNYRIVEPRSFAYVPDTSRRGNKISLALNNASEKYLVSSISLIFNTNNKLLPEYLMLFFSRDEFDRYARYNSWGSARENFTWNEMQEVSIPIPDIEVQQAIADIYKVYTLRKQINEKLKAQIKDICPILIRGSLQ